MLVTLHFEIDNAQIEIAADVGLDTKGRVIARSCRNCANRVWAKNNIEALKDSGMAIQLIIKNLMNSSNEESQKNPLVGNESDDSKIINQIPDVGIDWKALLKAGSYIDTDITKKLAEDDSDAYPNSAIKNILNTIYGRYNNCEELVKRIQNSLKDTEGNIAKAYNESLCEIKNELKHIYDSVNGIEDYIIHNCDDEEYEDEDYMNDDSEDEDCDDEEDDMSYADFFSFEEMMGNPNPSAEDYAEYVKENSNHKKKKSTKSTEDEEKSESHTNSPLVHDATLMCINGIYYAHNFYNNQTKMSVDKIHWVPCDTSNVPQEYKDIINQKYIIDIRTFVSGFSYCITMADPVNAETKLPVHNATTYKLLNKIFEMVYDLSSKTIGYLQIRMSKSELINYIRVIIFNNPETNAYFKVLNTSYNDAQKLRNSEEPNSPSMVFCSRYDGPHWVHDFVDLDALTRNVVNFIIEHSNYTI